MRKDSKLVKDAILVWIDIRWIQIFYHWVVFFYFSGWYLRVCDIASDSKDSKKGYDNGGM